MTMPLFNLSQVLLDICLNKWPYAIWHAHELTIPLNLKKGGPSFLLNADNSRLKIATIGMDHIELQIDLDFV